MNGEQIERLLRNIKEFDGVFAIDNLPDNPRLLVCNLDPSHIVGQINETIFQIVIQAPNLACILLLGRVFIKER